VRKQRFPPAMIPDGRAYTYTDIGHGRIEERIIHVLPMPAEHAWQSAAQCFRITRRVRRKKRAGLLRDEIVYGITSLRRERASPEDLLSLHRNHWAIENSLHWVRDTVLREDASILRSGNAPHANAALNNLALQQLRDIHPSIRQAIEVCQCRPHLLFKSLAC
jgi:predicted transposase YbfD/YdcC